MILIAAILLALGVALLLASIRVIQSTLPSPTPYRSERDGREELNAGRVAGAMTGKVWLRRLVGAVGVFIGFILCFIGGGALIRELLTPVAG